MATRVTIEETPLTRKGGTLLSIKVRPMKAGPRELLLIEKKDGK